jgi:hypothetical protein
MPKKKKTKKEYSTKAYPREPKELQPLGIFRKNLDYGEGPYFGIPQSIPEYRKRRARRLKRKKALEQILRMTKIAGIIKPPPETYKRVVFWAQQAYANYFLWEMEQKGLSDKKLEEKCRKKYAVNPENILLKNQLFRLEDKDWKYSNTKLNDDNFIVEIKNNPVRGFGGFWKDHILTLNLKIPTVEELIKQDHLFDIFMYKVAQVIGHELVHMVQYYVKKDDFGLPSKSIRSKRDPSGHKLGPTGEPTKHRKIKHSLRDIEFYPRIYDQIYTLKNFLDIYSKYPESIKPDTKSVIKSFIGATRKSKLPVSEFFTDLKKHSKEKWKKAVKELVSQLMKEEYLS